MKNQAIESEIAGHKSQLNDFLSARFIDQSLILGFNTVVQSKFQKWIVEDVENFFQRFAASGDIQQVDSAHCELIELLRVLWSDFHHPIIKLYQKQHAELYSLLSKPSKYGKKNLKVVEMRKLHEMLGKYVKAVKTFYTGLMTSLDTKYANPLIPLKYLQEFDIAIPPSVDGAMYPDFHSTLSYITVLCLLGLGNLTRSWAQIKLTYVEPSKSAGGVQKHAKEASVDKSQGKSLYIFPLLCYSKCVGLLPTMHEPYNHIGVIYNSLGQKFSAILWFLRCQFTRDSNNAVGRRNLISAFTRPWLEEAYDRSTHKTTNLYDSSDANNIFLRIIGDYFYPSAFRKSLYREKVEADFLSVVFSERFFERFVKNTNIVTEHLTVFICFHEFALQGSDTVVREKFGALFVRYITTYLSKLNVTYDASKAEAPLKNLRLILGYIRKNRDLHRSCGYKFLESLVDALNALQDFDGEETRSRIVDAFMEGRAPIRSHYFAEDIHFKDFTPIGCQFKDFDDTHLFESGKVHLLFGSYFYESDQGIAGSLDNEAVLRIEKEVELAAGDKLTREKAVAAESLRAEIVLRLQSSVVLTKNIFGTRVNINTETNKLEAEEVNVPKTQSKTDDKASRRKTKAKNGDKPKSKEVKAAKRDHPVSLARRPSPVQVAATVPSSFEEIELMILGHAPKMKTSIQDLDRDDVGLANMVLSIVSDDETRDSSSISGHGLHDASNDGFSKSTESSRVETAKFTDHAQFSFPAGSRILQPPGQPLMQQTAQNDGANFAAYGPSAYQNPQVNSLQEYPQNQSAIQATAGPQQQPQWFMGFNGDQMLQMPQGVPFGANVPPSAYPTGPTGQMAQPNAMYYPGMSQFHSYQAMPQFQNGSMGVFPPPYMMPQYPPNTSTQESQTGGMPYQYGVPNPYPQYSHQ